MTTIQIPFSSTVKWYQRNHEHSSERGGTVPDLLQIHPQSGHPTDSGRQFEGTNHASSRRYLTVNRVEACDGCGGPGDEFYRYTTWQQPNDTSTEHVRDEYAGQFGGSAGWVRVNILSTPWEEFRLTSTSECVRLDLLTSQLVASLADWHSVWYLDSL